MTVDETALAAYLTGQHRAPLADGRDVELSVVVTIAAEVAREHGLRGSELSFGAVTSIDNPDIEAAFPGTRDGADLLAASGTPARTATIARLLCEQEPNPASRVALTRDRDELGIPKASLDWRLTGDDRASIVRSLEVYGSELARTGLGRFKIDLRPGLVDNTPWDGTLDFDVNNSSHHMGTARMHASPRQGVVDPYGRVHSVANLYVAGSSVFPTTGPQPPTVTIVALAIRLADHLRTAVLA
jgi:choline dehydrogenase-like flavoprotein